MLLLFCLLAPAWAAGADGIALFRQGVKAFQANQFQQAAELFERANRAGINKPALHYNLGVAYYRSGDLGRARSSFEKAALDSNWAALSSFNLGLIAKKSGEREKAIRLFKHTLKISQDQNLIKLTELALKQLSVKPGFAWYGIAELDIGFDSNVGLSDDGQLISASGNEDEFLELTAVAIHPFSSGILDGWKLSLDLYWLDYLDLDEFDQTLVGAEMQYAFAPDKWSPSLAGRWEYLLVDGELVQRTLEVGLETKRVLYEAMRMSIGYGLTVFEEEDPSFASLSGLRHQLDIELKQKLDSHNLRYGYLLELNDRDDLSINGDFFSQSATRHALFLASHLRLNNDWRLDGRLEHIRSNFDDAEIRDNVLQGQREDKEWSLFVNARRKIFTKAMLSLGWSHTDNNSNFTEFSYSSNIYRVGLIYPF